MDPQNITSQPQPTRSISLPLILGGFILLLLAGAGGFYLGKISNKSNITPTPTQVKPNCEFVPCPTQANQSPNQKETKYTCPQNGWVDCMPILSEEGKKACSQGAVKWYKVNCPNFKGLAK